MLEAEALDTRLAPEVIDAETMRLVAELRAGLPRILQHGLDDPEVPVLREAAAMLAPGAAAIAAAEDLFDPVTAPEDVLPWLATWFGWGHLFVDPTDPRRHLTLADAFPPGVARLRGLLVAFPYLQELQGRRESLAETLRIMTGDPGISVEQDATAQHLVVRVPSRLTSMRPWITRQVHAERPAHLTAEVVFAAAPTESHAT